jgi:hypothetical protein
MIDMTKPNHNLSMSALADMGDAEWLSLVATLAYSQRASTMVEMVKLARERGCQRIVETGCIRGWGGDGQSTLILAMLAVRLHSKFESFDISAQHVSNAQKWLGEFQDVVRWHTQDSVAGLSQLQGVVNLVYLDSYDYDAGNPVPCQLHQLAEVGAIYGKLAENAVIVMDDAGLNHGGKVAMAVDFLKQNGWKEIAIAYQVILTRI